MLCHHIATASPPLNRMLPCSPNLAADKNHLERIQRFAIRSITGTCHLLYEDRLQRLCLLFLHRRRLWAGLITVFKILTDSLDADLNLLLSLPLDGSTPTRYSELRATDAGEGWPFCWGNAFSQNVFLHLRSDTVLYAYEISYTRDDVRAMTFTFMKERS